MRALVLTNLYPPHHYGGYELLCHDTVAGWRASGHDVAVVCSDHRIAGVADGDEIDVERSLRFYWRDFELLRPPPLQRLAIERSNRAHWTKTLDRVQPDVVSVWNYGMFGYPVLAEVVRRDIPLVLVIGDLWPCWGPSFDRWTTMFTRGRTRHLAGRLVERLTGIATTLPDLGSNSIVLPASEWLRTRLERDSPFHFQRMEVVPHGFSTRDFPIIEPRPDGDSQFGWHLLLPGRLDDRKGWRTAVRALGSLPEATLTLAGGGEAREVAAVRAVAEAVGAADRVEHVVVERAEMAALYRRADVVLFPSEWNEPFGIVGLEAMACAVPVVATGTGGSGEYLTHESNCLLFEKGDPDALAAAVGRLAQDAGLRRRLVDAGRATAETYRAEATVRALEARHVAASEERTTGGNRG
jgi:glycosyltransferase involved in cell wall biosynthesis